MNKLQELSICFISCCDLITVHLEPFLYGTQKKNVLKNILKKMFVEQF